MTILMICFNFKIVNLKFASYEAYLEKQKILFFWYKNCIFNVTMSFRPIFLYLHEIVEGLDFYCSVSVCLCV